MDVFCITFWLFEWLAPDVFIVKEIIDHGGIVTTDGVDHIGIYIIAFCALIELSIIVCSTVKVNSIKKKKSPETPHIVSTSYRPANDFQCGGKGRDYYDEEDDELVNQTIEWGVW